MPSARSTQPRLVTEPTMKPMLAPPRHSSTPTCTDPCCAEVVATDPDKARAIPARASERRMNKSPDQVRGNASERADQARSLWHNGGRAARQGWVTNEEGPLKRAL